MAKTPVEFLPAAVADLDDLFDYILAVDPQAAEKVLETIMTSLKRLEDFPSSGALFSERALITYQFRTVVASPYIVFYRLLGGRVLIYRVLHEARDCRGILKTLV